MSSLFDEKTGVFNIDENIMKRNSYKKIMEDGIITEEEVRAQSELVISLLKKIEEKLDEEEKKTVIDAMSEMLVLYSLYQKNIIDDFEGGL